LWGILWCCDCHVFHQYTLKKNKPNGKETRWRVFETKNDIPCGVYYPIPLLTKSLWVDGRYRGERLSNPTISERSNLITMHTDGTGETALTYYKDGYRFVNGIKLEV